MTAFSFQTKANNMQRPRVASIHQGLDRDELMVLFKLMEKEEKENEIIKKLMSNIVREWPCEDEDEGDELEGGRWSDFGKKGMDSDVWVKFAGKWSLLNKKNGKKRKIKYEK